MGRRNPDVQYCLAISGVATLRQAQGERVDWGFIQQVWDWEEGRLMADDREMFVVNIRIHHYGRYGHSPFDAERVTR